MNRRHVLTAPHCGARDAPLVGGREQTTTAYLAAPVRRAEACDTPRASLGATLKRSGGRR